jgi:hypothetical protein
MKRMTQALQVLFAASCGKAELYREKIASRLQGMREFYRKNRASMATRCRSSPRLGLVRHQYWDDEWAVKTGLKMR